MLYTYHAQTSTRSFMSMDPRAKFPITKHPVAVVIRRRGKRGKTVEIWSGRAKRSVADALREARDMVSRFEHYQKDKGRCWYDDQVSKREAKEAAREKRRKQTNWLLQNRDEIFAIVRRAAKADDHVAARILDSFPKG